MKKDEKLAVTSCFPLPGAPRKECRHGKAGSQPTGSLRQGAGGEFGKGQFQYTITYPKRSRFLVNIYLPFCIFFIFG
jgi:hypothetical protein